METVGINSLKLINSFINNSNDLIYCTIHCTLCRKTEIEFLGETSWVNDSWWNEAEDAAQYITMRRTFCSPQERCYGWKISAN